MKVGGSKNNAFDHTHFTEYDNKQEKVKTSYFSGWMDKSLLRKSLSYKPEDVGVKVLLPLPWLANLVPSARLSSSTPQSLYYSQSWAALCHGTPRYGPQRNHICGFFYLVSSFIPWHTIIVSSSFSGSHSSDISWRATPALLDHCVSNNYYEAWQILGAEKMIVELVIIIWRNKYRCFDILLDGEHKFTERGN